MNSAQFHGERDDPAESEFVCYAVFNDGNATTNLGRVTRRPHGESLCEASRYSRCNIS